MSTQQCTNVQASRLLLLFVFTRVFGFLTLVECKSRFLKYLKFSRSEGSSGNKSILTGLQV